MLENSKCFIKTRNGKYEEITYRELKELRNMVQAFKKKKFIKSNGMLFEVNLREYNEYYRGLRKRKYIESKYTIVSIDAIYKEIENGLEFEIEKEIEKRFEIDKLHKALLSLNAKEYEIIKNLFFKEMPIRKYAESIGIAHTTLQYRKDKIIEKLKKYIQN